MSEENSSNFRTPVSSPKNLIPAEIKALQEQIKEFKKQNNEIQKKLSDFEKSIERLTLELDLPQVEVTKTATRGEMHAERPMISVLTALDEFEFETVKTKPEVPRNYYSDVAKTIYFSTPNNDTKYKLQLQTRYTYMSDQPGSLDLQMASVSIACEKGGSFVQKRDYFIHMDFLKDGQPTGVNKWFQFMNATESFKSNVEVPQNICSSLANTVFAGRLLKEEELGIASVTYSAPNVKKKIRLTVSFKLIVKYYEKHSGNTVPIPLPMLKEEKISKLFNLKGQLHSEVTFISDKRISVTIHKKLLEDCSQVFNPILSEKGHSRTIAISLSTKALKSFYYWMYGMEDGLWLEDVPMNLELLKFADEFMICELIQICTDNLMKIRDEYFTIDLIFKLWKFTEKHHIPRLENRVIQWLQIKSGSEFRGSLTRSSRS